MSFHSIKALAGACLLLLVAASASATIFATVKGVVHDPQHRPVPGAVVTLKARQSDWTRTTATGADGAFQIPAVPVGDYSVSVALQSFAPAKQDITVTSGTAPVLHIQLELAGVSQTVTVSAGGEGARAESATTTTLVDRQDIQNTPGADRSNSLEAITAFVPGAYVTHDQLHIRGGHQVSWLIDGVPVPNTNIASNVGPQFDPKDIDFLEVQRGSYDAAYGDRTYGVFNVVPRTGFERNQEAELIVSAGAFHQTNDQFSLGSHTQRFAYYFSGSGNRSALGLGTPVAQVLHDRETGWSGFSSLIFNADADNQLRVMTSLRRDTYQIPNAPDDQAAGINDVEHESDAFINFSWVRTFHSGMLLTVSPFFHANTANFDGGPQDFPIATTDERTSRYGGAQATFGAQVGTHSLQAGFYGFHQQDHERFGLIFNDGSNPNLSAQAQPSGNLVAVFAQDNVRVTPWLTVTAGVRQTHFSGGIVEDATSPRVGAALEVPQLKWVVRGFYGRFYQAPPLITASGPLLAYVTGQDLGFIPLRGERDTESQVGVTIPFRGWTADADHFQTRATNFFDHNPVGNSNIFFPVTIDGALIRGWEATLRSPRTWTHGQVHVAYSHQTALGSGSISGGLTDFSSGGGSFLLDHDQRNTLSAGFDASLSRGFSAATNVSYGSGFTDAGGPAHLPGHTTINATIRRSLGSRASLSITALNAFNSQLLIDNSLTFGGTHFNSPREIYAELRYRFHY
jgi:outer membrane cobalamin receptor